MTKQLKAEPVYYHDCRALGPHVRTPRAFIADRDGEYVLGYQHKCPFCSKTAGEFVPASGVTVNSDGSYLVDTRIAEKMRSI